VARRANLIHCSYHKCLTVYYARVIRALYDNPIRKTLRGGREGYKHFNSNLDEFYESLGKFTISSVNNHALDLDRLGEFRIVRFVRDPRDLVVSGYFYHRRGAEEWCNVVGPSNDDWRIVNGNVPRDMPKDHSLATYLQALDQEDALIAEIEFRKFHFESMFEWPLDDSRIRMFRYEDIMGNEPRVFGEVMDFYNAGWIDHELAMFLARKFAVKTGQKGSHVRDPEPHQWKKYFTPKVHAFFSERYEELLPRLGYQASPSHI